MNNDQNQLNQVGTITPNVTPTPQPVPSPEGVSPVIPPVAPVPSPTPVEVPAQPVGEQAHGVIAPPVTDAPAAPSAFGQEAVSPVAPAPVNLQPEGVVAPPPAPSEQANAGVVEPLMGTSLNDATTFVQPQAPGTVPPAPQAPVAPNPNNQIGMIGGVPTPPPLPSEADAKPKKDNKKLLIIILAAVLVLGVGFGAYYFLVLAKQKDSKSITPILNTLELGSALDTSLVANFVNLRGYTSSECSVTTNLNPNAVRTYEYTVTCGKNSVNSTVEVKDTVAPVVTLRDVIVLPGTSVKPEDFVLSANDASTITYKFEAEDDYSSMDEGTYDVNIIASDAYDNSATFTGKLIIDEGAPEHYSTCAAPSNEGNYTVSYVFGINTDGEIYNVVKKSVWTYNDATEYQTGINTYNEANSLDGISGEAVFDANQFTITITSSSTTSEVAADLNVDEPASEEELDEIFEGTCAIEN